MPHAVEIESLSMNDAEPNYFGRVLGIPKYFLIAIGPSRIGIFNGIYGICGLCCRKGRHLVNLAQGLAWADDEPLPCIDLCKRLVRRRSTHKRASYPVQHRELSQYAFFAAILCNQQQKILENF
jgi:hypothetical protein